MKNFIYVFLFLITATTNSVIQLLFKRAALNFSTIMSADYSWLMKLIKIFVNPQIISIGVLMLTTLVIWLKILSHWELTRAYPINIALTVIITFIASIFLFNESVTVLKIIGAFLIISGLWFILS